MHKVGTTRRRKVQKRVVATRTASCVELRVSLTVHVGCNRLGLSNETEQKCTPQDQNGYIFSIFSYDTYEIPNFKGEGEEITQKLDNKTNKEFGTNINIRNIGLEGNLSPLIG